MAYALKGPVYSGGSATTAGKLKGPVYDSPAPANTGDGENGAIKFLTELLRNFNDSLTFGLYDKGLRATGIDPDAVKKTKESNPIAKIIGQTAGGIPGGIGLSEAAARAVPALAKSTIPSIMGNSAASSAGMSTLEQFGHEGSIDPIQLAEDTAFGGLMGAGAGVVSRVISPGARVRARGNDLTPAEKDAAVGVADMATSKGISLDIPEALKVAAPGKALDVAALQNEALQSPKGSQSQAAFDAARAPNIEAAGKSVVDALGPKVSPWDLHVQAQERLADVKGGFNDAAAPLFEASAGKKLPPSWVPKSEPGVAKTIKLVKKDASVMKLLGDEIGTVPEPNHITFLNEVASRLRARGAKQADAGGSTSRAAFNEADQVQAAIDRSPAGRLDAQGRDIKRTGKDTLDELEAGPLGKIAKSPNAATQGTALFGVSTEAEAEAAKAAAKTMQSETARGILANHLDSAVSKNPIQFGKKALTNEHALGVADEVAGDTNISDTLRAAKAVKEGAGDAHDISGYSPLNLVFRMARAYGQKGVAEKLQDPKWIKQLGKVGITQKMITQALDALERTSSDMRGGDDPYATIMPPGFKMPG